MDQKRQLSKFGLYLFEGKILNYQEAGNAIWGAAMYYLGFAIWTTKLFADMSKRMQATVHPYSDDYFAKPDQINEQNAIGMGWEHVASKLYIQRWQERR